MCRECRERFPRHRLQRKPLVSDAGMHHGTCVTHAHTMMHVGIANLVWRGWCSRHSRRMHNPFFFVSGKRPIPLLVCLVSASLASTHGSSPPTFSATTSPSKPFSDALNACGAPGLAYAGSSEYLTALQNLMPGKTRNYFFLIGIKVSHTAFVSLLAC